MTAVPMPEPDCTYADHSYPAFTAKQVAAYGDARAKEARAEALGAAAKVCDEMQEHYSAYKDTALLNGDVDLSIAASGEPRACEFLASAIRALMKEPGRG